MVQQRRRHSARSRHGDEGGDRSPGRRRMDRVAMFSADSVRPAGLPGSGPASALREDLRGARGEVFYETRMQRFEQDECIRVCHLLNGMEPGGPVGV